ncbi:papilin-like isoform X2 [Centruroides sculpturatus]|uniref:papilin-like isoform X2 n=1 Tax=Centruroides sculpturatus TaxID=218467 RepID=UPI000C6D3724|nr:papilin-like isoform X2 [Centruroides sculpturatus]
MDRVPRQFLVLTFLLGVCAADQTHLRHNRYRNVTYGLHRRDAEHGPWGEWSESSPCSRTCGGGIAFQTRRCTDPRPESCLGPWKMYFSCNIQDCPEGSKDFREEQCSNFDRIPFEGKRYRWVPYHKAPNSCELNCMPKGERFYYRHSRKVIDGTRCRDDGSLDVCVDGTCMPVGCDMMLGSESKEDKCRECGGDGLSCKTVEGLFDLDNLQVGYNDILLIPAGATNIFVKERHATNNYLAIRNLTGHFYLNGNWRIEFPRSLKFAGTTFHYERKPHGQLAPETLRALGPITESVFIVLLYQEKNQGISYEYSIPNGVSNAQPDTYSWIYGDFGQCSKTCGGGHRVRPVNCARTSNFEVVADYLCDPSLKPPINGSCNVQPCPARWHVGEWDACSHTCGGGMQYRLVHCQRMVNGGSVTLVPEEECPTPKPAYVRKCNREVPCPRWHAGPWSTCNKMCGEGNQTRLVVCQREHAGRIPEVLPDSNCKSEIKPEATRDCDAGPCEGVEWIVSDWTGCDGTCGLGMESREVHCSTEDGHLYPLDKCETKRLPTLTRPCSENLPCHPIWHSSEWSECSAKCGTGIQTRLVFCGIWEGQHVKKVNENKCKANRRPESMQNCTVAPCKGMWFSSPWNRCSAPCGGGHRVRKVMCLHKEEMVSNNRCDPSTRPFHKEPCNLHPCDEDEIMMVGGCKNSKYGCCPDGVTPAGINFEGCPPVEDVPPEGCEGTEFGCCADGVTPALGLFKKGCPKTDTCNDTKYGCCPDAITPAKGPEGEGCPDSCQTTAWGCCPDGLTPAAGEDQMGCDPVSAKPCHHTPFGCCPDGIAAAEGPDNLGCEDLASSGEECVDSRYGCCPDGLTPADGPHGRGCPEDGAVVRLPTPTASTLCHRSRFGCCPDGTAARGPEGQGCTDVEGSGEPPADCGDTVYGCCPDGITTASGPQAEGCEEIEVRVHCGHTAHGCCPDGITAASGPGGENCPTSTPASTESSEEETVELPDSRETTTSSSSTSSSSSASSSSEEDISKKEESACSHTHYGCCADGISTALGPNGEGCCHSSLYGCCPDNSTAARGPDFGGCDCHTYPHGCCPDGVTPASGQGYYGCSCHTFPHGCCPDGRTAATGPDGQGCSCKELTHGCCPDGRTAASGPGYQGCGCLSSKFGCCPDGTTPAGGRHFEGCPCVTTPYGCCPDGVTAARGSDFEGCPETPSPPVTRTAGDACGLPKERGPCHDYAVKWFFDMNYGGCSRFWYGGCDGNANRFDTQEECQRICVSPEGTDACFLPRVAGPCEGSYPSYYFDKSSGKCRSFVYGGCLGNNNRFETEKLCRQTCVERETLDECERPLVVGPCRGEFPRWYYDKYEGRCKQFLYGGCKGNGNNFESERLCVERCAAPSEREICILPKVEGPCLGNFPRWYYDYMDGHCKEFIYSGCRGNRNRFVTKGQCEKICNATRVAVSSDICTLPKAEGPCRAAILHWFYDSAAGRCQQFYYGGCEGNANRFENRGDCERACLSDRERNICHLPRESGNCFDFAERWYHDADAGQCRRFYYSGCGGNENNFVSYHECERKCGKPTSTEFPEDVFSKEYCFLEQEAGPCSKKEIRWFYDKTDGVCKEFYYGGCNGNGNRFRSRKECVKKCGDSQDICTLPKVQGPCSGSFPQWYYDQTADRCWEFSFSGCQGNANRFDDRESCELRCRKNVPTQIPVADDACEQKEDPGPCLGYYLRWTYDKNENLCKNFVYGGCEGNENRFESRKDCEKRCVKKHGGSKPETSVYREPQSPASNHINGNGAAPRDEAATQTRPGIPVEVVDALTCPPSAGCEELQCPYGVDRIDDDRGCRICRCTNPCRDHRCPPDTQCVVEVDGARDPPAPEATCRPTSKPGRCPGPEEVGRGSECVDRCHNDAYCRGDQKCCSDGCALRCVDPLFSSTSVVTEAATTAASTPPPAVAPRVQTEEEEKTAEPGSEVVLECAASGVPAPRVSWTKDGRPVDGADGVIRVRADGSLHLSSVAAADAGNYSCLAENPAGRAGRWVVLRVAEPLTVEVRSDRRNYRPGATVRLDCAVKGSHRNGVRWYFGNSSAPAESDEKVRVWPNGTLTVEEAEIRHGGRYVCLVEGARGPVSASLEIQISDVDVPEDCTDKPYFANCDLIVKANYCVNQYYAKFCCRSCTVAGQLSHSSQKHS